MVPNIINVTGLTMGTHASSGFVIPVYHRVRGVVTRLYVVQTGGSLDGFTYALYSAAYACPPGDNPSIPVDAGLYNVVPPVVVPTAKADYQGQSAWPSDGINHLWQPYSTGADQRAGVLCNQQQLYLLITAGGTPTGKLFAASVTVDDAVYT